MTRARMIKDLARSGISESQAKKLKLKVLTNTETQKLGHLDAPSYRIPYFDTNGVANGYYRVRYLEEPRGRFGETMDKAPRYSGPAGVPPHAYFSPVVKWMNPVASDTTKPVMFTEGEKKAHVGCLAGGYVIGLGGVAMFQARKVKYKFLPELEAFDWSGRDVIICFDSDKATNPNIIREQNTLALRLLEREAHVYICDLPEVTEDVKTGLDDYLCAFPRKERASAFEALVEVALENEYATSGELWQVQGELCYIRRHGAYYHFEQDALIKNVGYLESGAYANRFFDEPTPTEDDPHKTKSVNAFKAWREWGQRREHDDIVYAPGQDEVVDEALNVWPGWGCAAERGSVVPFSKLVDFLFTEEPELKAWFWQWLAYPIQHPGSKLYSAVVLHGPMQGTGKTFLGEIVGDIYGQNFSLLSQDDLEDKFNDAFARKQFCLADEVVATGKDARKHADKLKGFITRQSIPINRKFEAKYNLRDTLNYLFTSNHFDAIYLERDDRRYSVVKVPDEPLSRKFYSTLRAWRRDKGPERLRYHLENEIDLTGFDATDRPPDSESHREMVYTSFSDIDAWCHDLASSPDNVLVLGRGKASGKTLWTASELLMIYDTSGKRGTQPTALGKAMQRSKFPFRIVRTKSGSKRLYAVRDLDKWRKADPSQWAKQHDSQITTRDKVT